MGAATQDHESKSRTSIFWGEIAPSQHLVHIYAADESFLDSLEGFIYGGLKSREGVIVIATAAHREALEERLRQRGVDVASAVSQNQYIALDAQETLGRFMVRDWPDEERFRAVVHELIERARGPQGRSVRAFGEMVALLWSQGYVGATVNLEHLWHQCCSQSGFSLFCAYPKIGFTKEAEASMREICDLHSLALAD